MSTPANAKALHTGSGVTWEEWAEWLDAHGARELGHAELARLALGHILEVGAAKSPEWWAQGVAVAYEQHIGRRQPGQTCAGDFQVTVSKTVPGDMDASLARWSGFLSQHTQFDGVPVTDGPRISSTEKWRYWRATMADGSIVSVNFTNKPVGKSGGPKTAMAVNHDRLSAATEVERWRAVWKALLAELPTT